MQVKLLTNTAHKDGKEAEIFIIGEKAKVSLERLFR